MWVVCHAALITGRRAERLWWCWDVVVVSVVGRFSPVLVMPIVRSFSSVVMVPVVLSSPAHPDGHVGRSHHFG
jgi:hypothetical protein